ncbi:MAG: DNA replication/repair protein RecF [Synechocystis sp.]|nr:DNA replication/repair protein RecF [Synechocystis sp.]
MYLKKLYLRAFRNYLEQIVEFSAQKTILVGNNAQGKSNLLEAVELLATLKSHRTNRDQELVFDGAANGQIKALLDRQYSVAELEIILRRSGRRSLQINQTTARRQLDFLGTLNAVEFSCLDLDLVRGAPDCRRQWLDTLLTQLEPLYAHILGQYQHILKQRNALLKIIRQQTEGGESPNSEQKNNLDLWDQQLVEMGARVARRRSRGIERLAPLAAEWHGRISGETEQLQIDYQPSITWKGDDPQAVQQAFWERLEQRRIAEYQLGATVVGPHRDEIQFLINDTPAKTYGSQGQQRTLVLALKLAELSLIEAVIGEPPLLLLDDVLAELDLDRQSQLLAAVEDRFQTLITTTHLNRFDDQWRRSAQIFKVNNGSLEQLWLSEID